MFTTNNNSVAFDYGPAVAFDLLQSNYTLDEHTYIVEDLQHQYRNDLMVGDADYRLT